jgi:hypothetical protein
VSGKPVYHHCDAGCRDWVDVTAVGEPPRSQFVPGACKHRHVETVESVEGEILLLLCLCCDHVLPEGF